MTVNAPLPTFPKPTRNEPLARKVFDHIVAHPEEWDQSWWFYDIEYDVYLRGDGQRYRAGVLPACGTVACFAGTAALLDGATLRAGDGFNATANGHRIADYAQRALGITHGEADVLFDSDNDLRDLRSVLASIYGGEW